MPLNTPLRQWLAEAPFTLAMSSGFFGRVSLASSEDFGREFGSWFLLPRQFPKSAGAKTAHQA